FYNWYDTRTLSTLNPRYVSTVDSGNLIGHLLTLRQGILGVINQPIFNHRSFEGLRTTLDIIAEIRGDQPNETIEKMLAVLDVVSEDTSRMSTVKSQLEHLMKIGSEWKTTLAESDVEQSQISTWLTSLLNQLQAIYDDFNQQSPWLALLPVPDTFPELHILENVTTLSALDDLAEDCLKIIDLYKKEETSPENIEWLNNLALAIRKGRAVAIEKIDSLEKIAEIC